MHVCKDALSVEQYVHGLVLVLLCLCLCGTMCEKDALSLEKRVRVPREEPKGAAVSTAASTIRVLGVAWLASPIAPLKSH